MGDGRRTFSPQPTNGGDRCKQSLKKETGREKERERESERERRGEGEREDRHKVRYVYEVLALGLCLPCLRDF